MKTIYMIMNFVNRKIYIGQTKDLNRRIIEHKNNTRNKKSKHLPLYKDMVEYGFDNFYFNSLFECEDECADKAETSCISMARDIFGEENVYNICKGGLGGLTHDVSGKNNPRFGKCWTQEEKETVRSKLRGRKKPEGFGERVSKALLGRPKSKEAVAKKSHPISVMNVHTGEIINFNSKAEMQRIIHSEYKTLAKGVTSKSGYILYTESQNCISEDVETSGLPDCRVEISTIQSIQTVPNVD